MSTEIEFEILITGYIRELEDKHSFIVPEGIKKLILEFYPKKINYVGIFLTENAGHRIEIQADKLSFKGLRSAKLDQPLPISLDKDEISKIFRWRAVIDAKCIDSKAIIFGVTSNRCHNFHGYPFGSLMDPYGISMRNNRVFLGNTNKRANDSKFAGFKSHEIICMEYEIYNGNKVKLSFYNETKENEFIYSINLPNDIKEITSWYPVFSKPRTSRHDDDNGMIKVIPYE